MGAELILCDGIIVGKVLKESFLNPVEEVFAGAAFFVFSEFNAGFFKIFCSFGVIAQFFGQPVDEGLFRQGKYIICLECFKEERGSPSVHSASG
jgi:hypothetical protein